MARNSLDTVLRYLRRMALTGDAAHLLEQYASHGDEAAFERLVSLNGPMVLGLCRRLLRHEQDAEDAFQATFLTLARKAATISKKESVSSWLYKVAYRVACQARPRQLTNRMTVLDRVGAKTDRDVGDLRRGLDEEIAGLTETYRLPVVLCYLQGKTVDEAARLLGCPTGTVSSRLARAKEQLRHGLTRRGWTLSMAAVTATLSDKALAATLPAGLVRSTIACVANAGGLPARVMALSQGALHMLWVDKLKMAAGVVLAIVLAGTGTGLVVRQTWARGEEGRLVGKELAGSPAKVFAAPSPRT
jgi:RNA polymerase sigma factor (sigma-70 family)